METFRRVLQGYLPKIDQRLMELIPVDDVPEGNVHRAMRYSVSAGGKRLRPFLTIMGGSIIGDCSPEALLDIGCAVELIHTYSLIHDDLPALDNDDLRRGKPTNHKVFGEAMAILAGDGLLNQAFQVLTRVALPPERLLEIIRIIADGAGTTGMIGGQVVDMESEGKRIDTDLLRYMHEMKTGKLIRAALLAGAVAAGASEMEQQQLDRYAYNIGLAFQIADDILDIEGDPIKLGKPIGSDQNNAKSTWPSLLGLEASRQTARALVEEAVGILETFKPSESTAALQGLAKYVISRET